MLNEKSLLPWLQLMCITETSLKNFWMKQWWVLKISSGNNNWDTTVKKEIQFKTNLKILKKKVWSFDKYQQQLITGTSTWEQLHVLSSLL